MAPLTYYFFLLLGDPNRELDFDAQLDLFGLVAYPLIVVGTPLGCRLSSYSRPIRPSARWTSPRLSI